MKTGNEWFTPTWGRFVVMNGESINSYAKACGFSLKGLRFVREVWVLS